MHRTSMGLAGCLAIAMLGLEAAQTPPALPPRLERYLADHVRLSNGERRRLLNGDAVTKLLEVDASREVAVFAAIWIDAPIARYVEALNDIEAFERGRGYNITKRISSPPRLDDFADLRLPPGDIEDIPHCRVGDCAIKLTQEWLQRFQSALGLDAPAASDAANRLMRQIALEYVTGYLAGGDNRLAVYRDSSRPTAVGPEFREMIQRMPEFQTLPAMRRALLEFPKVSVAGMTSFLYWQEVDFGLKPTLRISHVLIHEAPGETVAVSKMIYASHYFWTGIQLRTLVPDPARGPGFWFVTVSRSLSDGLSGFTGFFVRPRVRGQVQAGALAALEITKRRLERGR
jgi:hypothetical protein